MKLAKLTFLLKFANLGSIFVIVWAHSVIQQFKYGAPHTIRSNGNTQRIASSSNSLFFLDEATQSLMLKSSCFLQMLPKRNLFVEELKLWLWQPEKNPSYEKPNKKITNNPKKRKYSLFH